MGNKGSSGKVIRENAADTIPQLNEPPYPGPSPEYRFINTEVANTGRYTLGGKGQELITSNVDEVYPMLASPYTENFRLLSFYKTPMVDRSMFSTTIKVPYQAIYYRYPEPNEGWRLQIEKSSIDSEVLYNFKLFSPEGTGIQADSSHIVQAISRHSAQGGRLICLEETGQRVSRGRYTAKLPTMAVDVFFDMPTHPNPEIYTYQIVTIPVEVKYHFASNTAVCDWAGHLANFLSCGWRLVEIFVDDSMISGKSRSRIINMNTTWFFEKPLSKVNDPTPVYQGTFIEHYVKLKGGFSGKISGEFGWEEKITQMSAYGWELACILSTPEMRPTGITTAEIKFLLFFQRKLVNYN